MYIFHNVLLLNHVNILTVQNRNEYKTKKIPSRMHSQKDKEYWTEQPKIRFDPGWDL